MKEALISFHAALQHWTMIIGLAALAAIALGAILYAARTPLMTALRAYRRLGLVGQLLLTPGLIVLIGYGSTKKTVITDLAVDSNPDSVIVTWTEDTNNVVNSVNIQRRIKGATENEAWETLSTVQGGIGHAEIDGFSLDRDFEYRAIYTYTDDDE